MKNSALRPRKARKGRIAALVRPERPESEGEMEGHPRPKFEMMVIVIHSRKKAYVYK